MRLHPDQQASQDAARLWPFILPRIERMVGGVVQGGGGAGGVVGDSGQFLLRDGTRSLTGNLAVGGGITLDGVDLSAHAANPDAHHNRLTLGVDSRLIFASQPGQSGLVVDAVTSGKDDPGKVLRTDGVGKVEVSTLWADTIGADGHLMIDPTSDLRVQNDQTLTTLAFNPGWPIQGWRIFEVEPASDISQMTIGKMLLDELHTRVFVADEVRVDRGEELWSKSFGITTADFAIPAVGASVSVTFEDSPAIEGALFATGTTAATGDWIMIKIIQWDVSLDILEAWGQVHGYVNNDDDTQTWTYTHRSDVGDVGYLVRKGSLVVCVGQSGQPIIHLSALTTTQGPWIQMKTWAGANPYFASNHTPHVIIGNLNSFTGNFGALNPTGYGLVAENAFLSGKLVLGAPDVVLDDNGVSILRYAGFDPNPTDNVRSVTWYEALEDIGTADPTARLWAGIAGVNSPGFQIDVGNPTVSEGSGYMRFYMQSVAGTRWGVFNDFDLFVVTTTDRVTVNAGSGGVNLNATTITEHVEPKTNNTYNLGSAGKKYANLFVGTLIADSVTGGTALGGQIWQYDTGDMFIRSYSTGTRTLYVANPDTGTMHLDVEGNITLGGTLDGVDVAGLNTSYTTHTGNANAHFAKQHDLDDSAYHIGTLAWAKVSKTGSSLADFTTKDHHLLVGLTDDDHGQYVHNTVPRTVSAVHTFQPGAAGAPFVLGANAQSQLVPGLRADQVNKSVVAGAGLTGGGVLTADRTLTINPGAGLEIAGDTVAVNLAATSYLTTASGLAVVTTSDGDATPNTVLRTDAAGFLEVRTFRTDSIGANADLTLDPAGSIVLPTAQELRTSAFSDLVTGIAGMRAWDRGSNYRQMTLGAMKIDELYARVFVADEVRIDRGEEYWSKSFGVVETDFNILSRDMGEPPTTVMDVWFEDAPGLATANLFSVNDWLLLRSIDIDSGLAIFKCWFQVIAKVADGLGADDAPRQQWRLARRSTSGVLGFTVKKGSVLLDVGQAGQGWVHLSALDQDGGPFIQIGDWAGADPMSPGNFTNRVRMGNLNGVGDYSSDVYGFAAAADLGASPSGGAFKGFTVDATSGLRLWNTNIATYFGLHQTGLWSAGGYFFLGKEYDGVAAQSDFAFYPNTGAVVIGNVSGPNMLWNPSGAGRLSFRTGTSEQAFVSSDGTISAGEGVVKLGSTGVNVYSGAGGANIGRWGNDGWGDFIVGSNIATGGPAGISLMVWGSARTYNGEAWGVGDILIGNHNAANVKWDVGTGQLQFRTAQSVQAYVDSTGSIKAGGGNVLLNAGGLSLLTPAAYSPLAALTYLNGASVLAEMYCISEATAAHLNVRSGGAAGRAGTMNIEAQNATGSFSSNVVLSAEPGAEAVRLAVGAGTALQVESSAVEVVGATLTLDNNTALQIRESAAAGGVARSALYMTTGNHLILGYGVEAGNAVQIAPAGVGRLNVYDTVIQAGLPVHLNSPADVYSNPSAAVANIGWKLGLYSSTYAIGVSAGTLALRTGANGWIAAFDGVNPSGLQTTTVKDGNAYFGVNVNQMEYDGAVGNPWTAMAGSYGTPWADFSVSYNAGAYKRFGDIIYLRGTLQTTSSDGNDTVVFTLPVACRPLRTQRLNVRCSPGGTGTGLLEINSAGAIRFFGNATDWMSLDGCWFATS